MKIILLQDIKKVGQRGAVATVADGYANNVLIPKKLAVPATDANLKQWERESKKARALEATNEASAKEAFSRIDGKTIILKVRANENGGLFEAVHEKQIAEAIYKEWGVSLNEDGIELSEPIKKIGIYTVPVSHQGAKASVTVSLEAV